MLRPWAKNAGVFLVSAVLGAGAVETHHRLRADPKVGDTVEPSMVIQPQITFPAPGLLTIRPQSVIGDSVAWESIDNGLGLIPSDLLKSDQVAVGFVSAPGTYRVRGIVAKTVGSVAHLSQFYEVQLVVGAPVPPIPPTPPTPPIPPAPTPTALRVLIVTDASAAMPSAQQKIITDPTVKAYLDAHTVKDGTQPAWRVWDKTTQPTNEVDAFKTAFARPRASHPWLIIGNGTDNGFEGPLPADSASLITLLKKYGGA